MRTATTFTASLLIASLIAPTAALAGSPHFIPNQTSATLIGDDLLVEFKEAGLPSGTTVNISVSGTFNLTLQCINGGGENPNDSKKTSITDDQFASGNFTVGKNGNVVGSLTLNAPNVVFSCPPGQTVESSGASWTGVTITDATGGVIQASLVLGNFSIG